MDTNGDYGSPFHGGCRIIMRYLRDIMVNLLNRSAPIDVLFPSRWCVKLPRAKSDMMT